MPRLVAALSLLVCVILALQLVAAADTTVLDEALVASLIDAASPASARLLSPHSALLDEDAPIAHTPLGDVLGRVMSTPTASSLAFLGIPYAAPPVGPLRWNDTEPVAPWIGSTLNATVFSPGCPQNCFLVSIRASE